MIFEPQNGWCTSVNQGRFEEHHDINHEMLYIIRNNKLSKGSNCRFVVAQVNLDGSIVYWDQKNNYLNDGGGHISASEYETSLGDAKNKLQPMKSNNQLNCNLNMNKKLIRLTESDLHKIVKESVNKILMEEFDFGKKTFYRVEDETYPNLTLAHKAAKEMVENGLKNQVRVYFVNEDGEEYCAGMWSIDGYSVPNHIPHVSWLAFGHRG